MIRPSKWLKHFTMRKLSFFIIFYGIHIALFAVGWLKQSRDPRLALLNELSYSVWISRGSGLCLSFDILLILLPYCRSILTWIRPKFRLLPLDETQWFHRQVAYCMLIFTVVHTCAHYVNFYNLENYQLYADAAIEIHYRRPAGITGHFMLLCMLLMYTTAHQKIRQQSFEAFWYTHHLFIPFLLAMYTHATGCFVRDTPEAISPFAGSQYWTHCIGYQGWRWELVGGGLYLAERIYRAIRSRRRTEIVKVIRHPYDTMEIQISKPSMRYKPGQWLFLNCPSISPHQWHPFTITSCPIDPYISVHVRQVGDFTRALGDALGAGPTQQKLYDALDPSGIYEVALTNGQQMPRLRLDGPYGAPAEDVFANEIAILVGTGIGVTPWASILKNIWHLRSGPDPPRRLRRVEFVWIARDTTSFEWFQALLASLEAQSLNAAGAAEGAEFLRIHIYLTQRVDADTANNIVLNSVGQDRDPLTELKSRTNFGRPDFPKLFRAMKQGIRNQAYAAGVQGRSGTTDVGVYLCGPGHAARDIRRACREETGEGVRFKFWKEHF